MVDSLLMAVCAQKMVYSFLLAIALENIDTTLYTYNILEK